jgi:hypothetical protein
MTDADLMVELTPDEVVVLQDAVAAEMARYLMYWRDECQDSFDRLIEAGRKLGMEL